jgi:hypothetical protein
LLGLQSFDVIQSRNARLGELMLNGRIHQFGDNRISVPVQVFGPGPFGRGYSQEFCLTPSLALFNEMQCADTVLDRIAERRAVNMPHRSVHQSHLDVPGLFWRSRPIAQLPEVGPCPNRLSKINLHGQEDPAAALGRNGTFVR